MASGSAKAGVDPFTTWSERRHARECLPCADAAVHPALGGKGCQRLAIAAIAVGLAKLGWQRMDFIGGLEAQPLQVLQDGSLVLGPAALAVVVLNAKQHLAAKQAGDPPDIQHVGGMAKMQVPGGARRKPGDGAGRTRGAARRSTGAGRFRLASHSLR